jgi:uracil-DNA glycosylase
VTEASRCPDCPYGSGLAAALSPAMSPRGDLASPIVIIGPSASLLEPFRTPEGPLLRTALSQAGLRRTDLLFTNAVACAIDDMRPAANAIRACHEKLVRLIESAPERRL